MRRLLTISALGLLLSCTDKPAPTPLKLTERYDKVLLNNLGYSQSISTIDLDGDDFPEFYIGNSWVREPNYFYRNKKGVLIKDTDLIIALDNDNSGGSSFGDFNNDGCIDLFVANAFNEKNKIYVGHCEGSLSFQKLELALQNWSYGGSWVDVDNDGYLDLYIANHHHQQNTFYQNENGKLHEIRTITNRDTNNSINAIWSDLNNDGYQDLLVANESANQLFQNQGNWKFKDQSATINLRDTVATFGFSTADFNNDGLMDIFMANWSYANLLYKNLGDFKFEVMSETPINKDWGFTEGSCWGDYDNDGYTDLFIARDGTNRLYKNIEGKSFIAVEMEGLTDTVNNSNGCVWVDFDLDGDLDLFIANGGNTRNLFFENSGNQNNWVKVKLKGNLSNRSAIGAKVAVYSQDLVQYQEVSGQSGGGMGCQKTFLLHFGLSDHKKIDSITVNWPSSAHTILKDPSINGIHKINE